MDGVFRANSKQMFTQRVTHKVTVKTWIDVNTCPCELKMLQFTQKLHAYCSALWMLLHERTERKEGKGRDLSEIIERTRVPGEFSQKLK